MEFRPIPRAPTAFQYKNLLEAERAFRTMRSTLDLRPVTAAWTSGYAPTCCCAGSHGY